MRLTVEPSCTRCGACAALCPSVFDVSGRSSRVTREPTASERVFVEAARLVCPTGAIRIAHDEDAGSSPDATDALLFHELASGAERVRWSLDDIPWSDIDRERARPELCTVVREMAFSENATYSATQRFLEAFFEDVDFTQWISVWFYEETRHPHVLVEWLRHVGDLVPADFVVRGRISTPFMRSVIGTLVTNVISEITAAQAYRHLARTSPEPVMAGIARNIAGDEARHAASFFRFARQRLAGADPDSARRDRARAVEVLQAWLGDASPTTHPVAQMIDRVALDMDFQSVRTRVIRVIGLLLDLPLRQPEDVALVLRNLLSRGRS